MLADRASELDGGGLLWYKMTTSHFFIFFFFIGVMGFGLLAQGITNKKLEWQLDLGKNIEMGFGQNLD